MAYKLDIARVSQLLDIVEKTTKVYPGFTHLISEAGSELREINEKLKEKAEEAKLPAADPISHEPPKPSEPVDKIPLDTQPDAPSYKRPLSGEEFPE